MTSPEEGSISTIQNVTPIKGALVREVNGIKVGGDSRFPFPEYSGVRGDLVFSLVNVPDSREPAPNSPLRLKQTSRHHGRTFELTTEERNSPLVLWADQNGILFGAISTKGNNLGDPRVELDEHFASGFRIRGMQADKTVSRILKASKILRGAGIESESIERIIKPSEVVLNGERITIDKLKAFLLEKAAEEASGPPQRTGIFDVSKSPKPEHIDKIKDFLESAEFEITIRGLQVNERFRDLDEANNPEQFGRVLSRVFSFVNQRERMEAIREGREPRLLDHARDEDILYYFSDYLPKRLARNIGKMHNLGLAHGFLTDHNLSLAGSIYDLDSVNGVLLGDVKPADTKEDFNTFCTSLAHIFLVQGSEAEPKTSYFNQTYGSRVVTDFFRNFTQTYLGIRGVNFDIAKGIEECRRETGETIDYILQADEREKQEMVKELEDQPLGDLTQLAVETYFESPMEFEIDRIIPRGGRPYGSFQLKEKLIENGINQGKEAVIASKIKEKDREEIKKIQNELIKSLRTVGVKI